MLFSVANTIVGRVKSKFFGWVLCSLLLFPSVGFAGDIQDAHFCLDVIDIPCAQKLRDRLLVKKPKYLICTPYRNMIN